MTDVYVYLVDKPCDVEEAVLPCFGGYTVYLNARLSYSDRVKAYLHAIGHIENNDFEKDDVQQIEMEAHYERA